MTSIVWRVTATSLMDRLSPPPNRLNSTTRNASASRRRAISPNRILRGRQPKIRWFGCCTLGWAYSYRTSGGTCTGNTWRGRAVELVYSGRGYSSNSSTCCAEQRGRPMWCVVPSMQTAQLTTGYINNHRPSTPAERVLTVSRRRRSPPTATARAGPSVII